MTGLIFEGWRRIAVSILFLLLPLLFLAGCGGGKQDKSPVTPSQQWFKPDATTAGVIAGRIVFSGRRPAAKLIDMDGDPQCAKQHNGPVRDDAVLVNKQDSEDRLGNVFVYIKSGLEGKSFEPPSTPVTIEQRGCWFGPRVQGIMVGQPLSVINADPLTHNIHPLAEINREWNQSQAPGDPPLTRKFVKPEVMIRVKCNIHNWMHAWIGAVAHPYFSVSGNDGRFSLAEVPPGEYTVEAWHETLGRLEERVILAPSGRNEIVFKFKGE